MNGPNEILYWNRQTRRVEAEQVYGERWLRLGYTHPVGVWLTDTLLTSKPISRAYGRYQDLPASRGKIAPFIRKFQIDMGEFEEKTFASFNDFFIRRFKPGKRPFVVDPGRLAAPAEARYLGWDRIREDQTFPVKGKYLSAEGIMGSAEEAQPFRGGPLLIARLCPVDYHRFHFPDDGVVTHHCAISGPLHSVNPIALQKKPEIFVQNERQVTVLDTAHFGRLALVDVGALCVGKIVQTHDFKKPFQRGDEKGYFLFGGSTVIVLGEPGRWRPSVDILEQTQVDRETLIRLGDEVGVAK